MHIQIQRVGRQPHAVAVDRAPRIAERAGDDLDLAATLQTHHRDFARGNVAIPGRLHLSFDGRLIHNWKPRIRPSSVEASRSE